MFLKRKIVYFIILIILGVLVLPSIFFVPCQAQEVKPVEVYVFHMTGCGGCNSALRFLGALTRKYPEGFSIKDFNLSRASQEVFDLYFALGDAYSQDVARTPIPIIYLGEKVWIGYDTSVGVQVEQELVKCMAQGCISPIEKLEQAGQKDGTDISTGGNIWLAWLIVIIVLGGIIFIVIKVSRR